MAWRARVERRKETEETERGRGGEDVAQPCRPDFFDHQVLIEIRTVLILYSRSVAL